MSVLVSLRAYGSLRILSGSYPFLWVLMGFYKFIRVLMISNES